MDPEQKPKAGNSFFGFATREEYTEACRQVVSMPEMSMEAMREWRGTHGVANVEDIWAEGLDESIVPKPSKSLVEA